ncbi:MAG: outer membrane protein [Rhodomicrobium sp.]
MSKLHRKLIGVSFLSAIALAPFAANAADLYRNPPPSAYIPPAAFIDQNIWAGFYAGLNGGYGWGDNNGAISASDGFTSQRAQPQGGFGGGQIGYNFQSGALVYGLETDFEGGDLSARSGDGLSKESVDWFGTVRGRVGYAFGHVLLYGIGGFAYGDVHQKAFDTPLLTSSGTQAGWVAGGGVEYKINPAWSLKGEYQYIDLGSAGLSDAANAVTTNSLDTAFQTVRFGLNYRFGGSSEPLK